MAADTTKKHFIRIRGANVNNLKNLSVDIPRDKFVVFTGLSGSGKSSLAFDTIYAEGQRRYMESLSSYARQFLGQMEKPDVESIEGLPPAISIDQKSTNRNPRSTVGTVTKSMIISDFCMPEWEFPIVRSAEERLRSRQLTRWWTVSCLFRRERRSSFWLLLCGAARELMQSFWSMQREADMYVCRLTETCMSFPRRSVWTRISSII